MRVPKLATVALVENKHELLVFQVGNLVEVTPFQNRVIELLNRGDNQRSGVVVELAHQLVGVGGGIHATRCKAVKFLRGLIVQILAIHHEQHLMHGGHVHDDLAGFERCQRLTWPGGVPDVAIAYAVFDLFHQWFRGVELVRAQYLQYPTDRDHGVMGNHLGKVARSQEISGEFVQVWNAVILVIRPEKGLRECAEIVAFTGFVIGKILGVHPVADHKNLHVLEQARACIIGFVLVTGYLPERLF